MRAYLVDPGEGKRYGVVFLVKLGHGNDSWAPLFFSK